MLLGEQHERRTAHSQNGNCRTATAERNDATTQGFRARRLPATPSVKEILKTAFIVAFPFISLQYRM